MAKTCIKFAPDIIRRLGEELNPSPSQSVLELVKNAYDADAKECIIEFKNTEQSGGSIHVTDDGDGMDGDDIENGWLVLGRSGKKVTKSTRKGRIPAGSKGLGRLAALRMGNQVLLTTRPKSKKTAQYDLYIDWERFEEVDLVDDVDLTIEHSSRKKNEKPGTEISIENISQQIGRNEIKRLTRELLLLADPFGDDPKGFKPVIRGTEYADLEELLNKRYFEDAEYHLKASVNKQGKAKAVITDWRGKVLFSAGHQDLSAGSGKNSSYSCPSVSFDLWVFILNSASFQTGTATLAGVKDWLSEFGGVHLYHNGLRVSPYGNPGHDWLEMNLRRTKNPEERPATHTTIGRVVVKDTAELLVQKTDRSGFIESEAFCQIQQFAQDAMEWMARRRLEVAEKRRAKQRVEATKRASKSKVNVEKAIKNLPERSKESVSKAFASFEKSKEREVQRLRQDVQLYRTLSTAGITAATFAHQSNINQIKVIQTSVNTITRRMKSSLGEKKYKSSVSKPIASIEKATASLSVLGAATLKLLDNEKRRTAKVDLHQVLCGVINTFEPFFDGRGIKIELELADGSPYLRGSEAMIESIVTNLLNNSIVALERPRGNTRRIVIRTTVENDIFELRVMDNGPGISEISKRDMWLPGQTTKPNGTGLGLAIVRDTVRDLVGKTDAVENGKLGGAEIIIELPVIGK